MSQTLLEQCCFLAGTAAGNPTHYMIEQALLQAELDWRFLTFEVDQEHLAKALEGLDVLGFRGVMLAEEFRTSAAPLLAQLTSRAQRAGAVNCLVRTDGVLTGDDTFGAAFVEAVGGEAAVADRRVMVIGSGRAARSIVAAASEARAAAVYLADSDLNRASGLIEELATDAQSETPLSTTAMDDNLARVPEGVSIVVFAPSEDETSHLQVDLSAAAGPTTMVDTRLRSSRTGLLRLAAEQGATIVDGVDLFTRETAIALEQWTGLPFDRAPLRELAEEFLGV